MAESDGKKSGFSQVAHPKQGLGDERPARRPSRRNRELAKTVEAPPPSAALKPSRAGVDPLAQTGVFPSQPPAEVAEPARVEPERDDESEEASSDDAPSEEAPRS